MKAHPLQQELLATTGAMSIQQLIEETVEGLVGLRPQVMGAVKLSQVASKVGVTSISSAALPCDGLLVPKDGGYEIWVNEDSPPKRQRFSIAHEIGHIVLHGFLPHTKAMEGRNLFTAPGNGFEERFCDFFAANLLMPRTEVLSVIAPSTDIARSVSQLAGIFQVSREAAAIRIAEVATKPLAVVSLRRSDTSTVLWRMRRVLKNFDIRPLYPDVNFVYRLVPGLENILWIQESLRKRKLFVAVGDEPLSGRNVIGFVYRDRSPLLQENDCLDSLEEEQEFEAEAQE